jgi:hypothetical protein
MDIFLPSAHMVLPRDELALNSDPADYEERKGFVGFEVFTAVVKKSSAFWDITPCNRLKVSRPFLTVEE